MYTIKNKTYADIGHVLKHKNVISFNFENVCENDVEEIKIDIDNIHIERNFIVYSKELQDYKSYSEYKDWKKKWVNKQFTNDDQIAIMLNKDDSEEDLLLFTKMQEWREWSGEIAKKIHTLISND